MFHYLVIVFIGFLSAYAQRPTDGTIAIRQDWGQLPQNVEQYDVLLSVPNCGLIGREGTLTVNEQVYEALVFDCAGEWGHNWMLQNLIAAEVDYYFWIDHPELIGNDVPVKIEIR